ncbi:MAG: DUF1801 domain-containing protein [Flavobacteriales bacterium]|nr:DUF1801 domain-containing protein [Flavobacteriales bacterium]
MGELKTKRNDASVVDFLNKVENEKRKADALSMLNLMEEITGHKAEMWGDSIVGFGSYQYKYASGQSGDWPVAGFSPRKTSLTIYVMSGFKEYEDLLLELGKFKASKGCLYINKLEDVNKDVLKKLIALSIQEVKTRFPN